MKKILYFLLFVPVLVLAQNHIKTTTYRVPTTTSVSLPTVEQAVVEQIFTDELGRPMQHIAHKQSSTGKDIVTHVYYDDFGRQSREYLPYVSQGSALVYDQDAEQKTLTYYNKPEYQNTQNPYSEQFYEPSPIARVVKQAAPGNAWKGEENIMAIDRAIKFEYKFNNFYEVKLFKANTTVNSNGVYETTLGNSTGTVFYEPNELYKSSIKDENWNNIEEFKDKQGRVVLKRAYDSGTRSDTYYIYDSYGNLNFVISPKAAASGTITSDILNKLCYQYRYDQHNRLVEKKQPGKAWEYIVYDKFDRVVATGPVYSPFSGSEALGWNIVKYDMHGRVAYTGWSSQQPATGLGRKAFQNQVDAMPHPYVTRANSTVDGISIGYNNNNTYPTTFKLLTVNYYDKYAYPGAITAPATVEGQSVTTNLKGLVTGSWVRVLTTSSATLAERTQIFYDQKARPIRVRKQNHLGGYTETDSRLVDFTGVVEYTLTRHKRVSGDDEITIREDFEYTAHGRLEKRTHQINNGTAEMLSYNVYNELGQLITKKVGKTPGTPLQEVDYKYNIRGWLTDINNVDNLGSDLFAFKISYENPVLPQLPYPSAALYYLPLYNGNISETYWKTASDNVLRKYGYRYDALNRLADAIYIKPGSSNISTPPANSYNEMVLYDLNGNITNLFRTGDLDSAVDNITIDQLTYNYDSGNRLMEVTDNSNHPEGFNNRIDQDDEFDYDDFGNLTWDVHKRITNIKYNHLNLPKEITFSGTPIRKITYLYNALGQKLDKKVTNGSGITTTDYQSGFQYENEVLRFFATSEGYVNHSFILNKYGVPISSYNYVYNYTDHLGNIRVSYTSGIRNNPIILEENHYYPFGLKHKKYGSVDKDFVEMDDETGYYVGIDVVPPQTRKPYQYKYNHREWQDELDLNVYAMDWRQYDPAIARWAVHDPVIHHSMSPYNAFDNNPVFWADPSGGNSIASAFLNIDWSNVGLNYNWDTEGYTFNGENISDGVAMAILNINEAFNITGEGGGGGSNSGSNSIYVLDYKPTKESFKFITKGNWQTAAVQGIYFNVTLLSYDPINGAKINRKYRVDVSGVTEFGVPVDTKIGRMVIDNKVAAEVTANVVNNIMKETALLFAHTEASLMQVEQYFREQLKAQFGLYVPGGRVNFNSMHYTGVPTIFKHE